MNFLICVRIHFLILNDFDFFLSSSKQQYETHKTAPQYKRQHTTHNTQNLQNLGFHSEFFSVALATSLIIFFLCSALLKPEERILQPLRCTIMLPQKVISSGNSSNSSGFLTRHSSCRDSPVSFLWHCRRLSLLLWQSYNVDPLVTRAPVQLSNETP